MCQTFHEIKTYSLDIIQLFNCAIYYFGFKSSYRKRTNSYFISLFSILGIIYSKNIVYTKSGTIPKMKAHLLFFYSQEVLSA